MQQANSTPAYDEYALDKARVRASFNRAAKTYDAAAVLQTTVRDEMLSRLDLISAKPHTILDAGCGTGHASNALQKRYNRAQIISLDLAFGMLQQTQAQRPLPNKLLDKLLGKRHLLCGDIDNLPIANNSLNLLWSNLAIQWCNNLDQTFAEFNRVLQPEGLLMFSTFGPDTLKELRAASQNGQTHVSRFIDMHDIGDALSRAGFSAPVLDIEHYTLTYDDVKSVMLDLKAIGAHNATAGRGRGLTGKRFFQQLSQQYEQFRQNGKLPATYEVIYAHAWKSTPKQQHERGEQVVEFVKRR